MSVGEQGAQVLSAAGKWAVHSQGSSGTESHLDEGSWGNSSAAN